MRGDNCILALKLHILLHILMKSICISFKPLQPTFIWWDNWNEGWQLYTSIKTTHFASYLDEIYTYLLQTFAPTFIWWDNWNEGWQLYTSIKTTHFASYLDEIYTYLLQTFTTHFHLMRQLKWGVTTLY